MDADDRDGHHTDDQRRRGASGEAGGERQATEEFDEAGEQGEGSGQVELGGEVLARPIDAVAAEPAEQLLRRAA
jgi:hypothetical protein